MIKNLEKRQSLTEIKKCNVAPVIALLWNSRRKLMVRWDGMMSNSESVNKGYIIDKKISFLILKGCQANKQSVKYLHLNINIVFHNRPFKGTCSFSFILLSRALH